MDIFLPCIAGGGLGGITLCYIFYMHTSRSYKMTLEQNEYISRLSHRVYLSECEIVKLGRDMDRLAVHINKKKK